MTRTKWGMAVAVLGVLLASSVWAQPPRERGEGRDNPKMQLGRFMMGIGLLEKNGKAKLSAAQAKKIVTAISPWRKKSAMTDAQAKTLAAKLQAVLTATQKKELQSLRPPRRGGERGGGERRDGGRGDGERRGPGGSGGPGGPGGGRGGPDRKPPTEAQRKEMQQRMEKMRAFYKTYNPFYPPSKYQTIKQMPERMREGIQRRFSAQETLLAQLAKKARS